MIAAGDRILVAVSGGKDSTALLCDLANRRAHWPVPYTLLAFHVQTEFSPAGSLDFVHDICDRVGVELLVRNVNVQRRLRTGERMNCYWCSLQRRLEILECACSRGLNKIAFGHHMDDIIETWLMNLMQFGGANQGMLPHLPLEKYPLSFIRPLVYVEEWELEVWMRSRGWASSICSCDFGNNSERKRIRHLIAELTQGMPGRKRNLLRAALGRLPQKQGETRQVLEGQIDEQGDEKKSRPLLDLGLQPPG
ncbi:MAG TPA: tRNA 2-thiocytidine biosynthesis TtcA family protein [Fibrobacteraceae bacterium]|nr:tRNA 2-thiocytidine biosynthesis TtcA family protein [Fibrobacteraceae bacterium]